MNKFFYLLLLSTFSLAGYQLQASNWNAESCTLDETATPSLSFEKTTMDYGKIARGSNGERVFKFTNVGDKPEAIASAKGSCGCTVPSFPPEMIAPGASNELKVRYDTNRVGKFTKSITVTTSAGEVIRLTVTGEVTA